MCRTLFVKHCAIKHTILAKYTVIMSVITGDVVAQCYVLYSTVYIAHMTAETVLPGSIPNWTDRVIVFLKSHNTYTDTTIFTNYFLPD